MKTTENAGATFAQIELLNVSDIVPDPKNRKDHDKVEIATLGKSIERDGLLQPVVVRAIGPSQFQLIAGERRWLAHQAIGRKEIPARVVGKVGENGVGSTRKRLAENFHRVDLSPIEKARDLEQLFKEGMTTAEVVDFVGAQDQSTVSNMMRLLKLPKKVHDWLQDGSLNAAHGKALLRFESRPKLVEAIAERAIDEGASSKALEKGLPFAAKLAEDGFVHDFEYHARTVKDLPKQYHADPDFIEAEGEYGDRCVFCLDPKKGQDAQKVLDQEREQRRAQQASSSGSGRSASVMSPAELAERKKQMEKNKAARAAIDATFAKAWSRLKAWCGGAVSAEVHDIPEIVRVVVAAALDSHQHSRRIKEAAAALDLKASSDKDFAALAPDDALRVAAMAVLMRQCDDAKRFPGAVPEAAKVLAGGEVKAAVVPPRSPKPIVAPVKKRTPSKPAPAMKITASLLAKVAKAKKGRR